MLYIFFAHLDCNSEGRSHEHLGKRKTFQKCFRHERKNQITDSTFKNTLERKLITAIDVANRSKSKYLCLAILRDTRKEEDLSIVTSVLNLSNKQFSCRTTQAHILRRDFTIANKTKRHFIYLFIYLF